MLHAGAGGEVRRSQRHAPGAPGTALKRAARALRAAGLALLAACSGPPGVELPASGASGTGAAEALADDVITVGSFDFAESELLALLYGQALQRHGYAVRYELRLGPRELVQPALAAGLVELVPEYAGTALQFLSVGADELVADPAATNDALRRAAARHGVVALRPAPAEDENAFVVTRRTAVQHGLRTLSDLGPVAPQLAFGGPPECPSRPLCLGGLERVYGLTFAEFLPLDAGGPLTLDALVHGHVDVALLFSTAPSLAAAGLVALEDDAHLQPSENVTPLVRAEVVQRFGDDLVEVLDGVSLELGTEQLRDMNALVGGGGTPAAVASAWLSAEVPV